MSNLDPITFNLLVTKLDKKRFHKGERGLYANLVLWPCEEGSQSSEYGDYLVKEQGKAGERLPILGNAKIFRKKNGNDRHNDDRRRDNDRDDDGDSIPF
jgi:hypothetical protein